jgi:hypothetical protein
VARTAFINTHAHSISIYILFLSSTMLSSRTEIISLFLIGAEIVDFSIRVTSVFPNCLRLICMFFELFAFFGHNAAPTYYLAEAYELNADDESQAQTKIIAICN